MRYNLGSHAQTAHVWAQNTQSEGYSGDKRIFFESGVIYSYGRHFAIASHVKDVKGNPAILFTTRNYSSSTSQHKSIVRNALRRDCPIHFVPDASCTTKDNVDRLDAEIKNQIEKYGKPRIRQTTRDAIANAIAHLIKTRNEYGKAFIKKYKAIAVPDNITKLADKLQKAKVAQAKREKKERAKAFEKALIEAESALQIPREKFADIWRKNEMYEKFDGWNQHQRTAYEYISKTHGILLRVKGDNIETSLHAEFPISHAKKAFTFIQKVRASKTPWHKNGHSIHLGAFQIDEIDISGNVKAGCHFVKWDEIELMAATLGII